MLGIRHYNNCAIDIWQGDVFSFVCDGYLGPHHLIPPKAKLLEITDDALQSPAHLGENLGKIISTNELRHIAIAAGELMSADLEAIALFWHKLKDSLPEQTKRKRLTITLSINDDYKLWQETMLSIIPES